MATHKFPMLYLSLMQLLFISLNKEKSFQKQLVSNGYHCIADIQLKVNLTWLQSRKLNMVAMLKLE